MEVLLASSVGMLAAVGVYLVLRARTFPVVLGLTFISHAVNLFLFGSGRLLVGAAPVLEAGREVHSDPLTQALVLTAIVISFGMTALLVVLALAAHLETESDRVTLAFDEEGEA